MCGRYLLTSPPDAVREHFGYAEQPNFPPRWNIAPTQPVAVVRAGAGGPSFSLMRWGLIPSWVKDPKDFPTLINARSEQAADKPAFRAAMRRRRCLLPADGFYEWQKAANGRKQPFLIRKAGGGVFAFAGLWETWVDVTGGEIDTVAILTTDAAAAIAPIHERMPVILPPEAYGAWLASDANPPEAVRPLLAGMPDAFYQSWPVSTRVNAVANDDEGLIAPLADQTTPAPVPRKARTRPAKGNGQMSLL